MERDQLGDERHGGGMTRDPVVHETVCACGCRHPGDEECPDCADRAAEGHPRDVCAASVCEACGLVGSRWCLSCAWWQRRVERC